MKKKYCELEFIMPVIMEKIDDNDFRNIILEERKEQILTSPSVSQLSVLSYKIIS